MIQSLTCLTSERRRHPALHTKQQIQPKAPVYQDTAHQRRAGEKPLPGYDWHQLRSWWIERPSSGTLGTVGQLEPETPCSDIALQPGQEAELTSLKGPLEGAMD